MSRSGNEAPGLLSHGLLAGCNGVCQTQLNCPDFLAFCMKIQITGYPSVRTYHFKGPCISLSCFLILVCFLKSTCDFRVARYCILSFWYGSWVTELKLAGDTGSPLGGKTPAAWPQVARTVVERIGFAEGGSLRTECLALRVYFLRVPWFLDDIPTCCRRLDESFFFDVVSQRTGRLFILSRTSLPEAYLQGVARMEDPRAAKDEAGHEFRSLCPRPGYGRTCLPSPGRRR